MRRVVALVVASVVVLLGVVAHGDVGASPSGSEEDPSFGTVDRVLVFSVPTLAWDELEGAGASNLEGFLAKASIAGLSVRSVSRLTTATDAYATLNAGTRAEGTPLAQLAFVAGSRQAGGLDEYGDPLEVPNEAFSEEEPPDAPEVLIEAPPSDASEPPTSTDAGSGGTVGTPMAEEFARRSGVSPEVGEVFNFGIVSMTEVNDRLLYGAEVGALGDALDDAGVSRAVVANGDHGEGSDIVDFRREASVGLFDADGLVEHGMVGRDLLVDDAEAPYGTRLDNDEVLGSFENMWGDRSVVLVEASDMVRAEDAKSLSTDSQADRQRREAIGRSDELFGKLMEKVDPTRDAVIVVAPYAEDGGTSLTVVGVGAPGVRPGLLSSGSTRRAGHVQTVDIAPTILSLVGLEPPSSMEGTPMESVDAADSAGWEARRDRLITVNEGALFRDRTVGFASAVFVVAQLLLWVGAWYSMTRGRRRSHDLMEVATLGVLLWLPATFLAGALPFHRWGGPAYWAFVVLVSIGAAFLVWRLTRKTLVDPLMVTLAIVVGLLSIDVAIGGPLQLNTVFGYTPTVAGRFDGMGNPAFSMFAAASIILAALVAHRIGGRRGAWAGAGLLAWAVVLDGTPFLGADVGGALTMVPAAAVTTSMLMGWKIRFRTIVIWGAAAVAVVVGLGLVDLARPATQRTHLGRLLADIGANGFDAFLTVVLRKLDANLSVLLHSVWSLMVPVVFASIAIVFWRSPGRLRTIQERIPEERAAVAGLLVAMLLGFALNDSGIAVPGMMLGVVSASLVHLMFRVDDQGPRLDPVSSASADPQRKASAEGSPKSDQGSGEQSVRL
jgi:hypothetical protein